MSINDTTCGFEPCCLHELLTAAPQTRHFILAALYSPIHTIITFICSEASHTASSLAPAQLLEANYVLFLFSFVELACSHKFTHPALISLIQQANADIWLEHSIGQWPMVLPSFTALREGKKSIQLTLSEVNCSCMCPSHLKSHHGKRNNSAQGY